MTANQIDWDDPACRLALLERVGVTEYNRLFAEHRKASVVATYGGHAIRPVKTRFGTLYQVGSTGKAFAKMPDAQRWATLHPVRAA